MPWILVPDPATLAVQPVTGLRFLSDNILMLIFLSLIIFTYAFSLKVKSIRILILLELELIFLIALLLSPTVSQGLVFFFRSEIWLFFNPNPSDWSCFLLLSTHYKVYSE